MIILAELVLQDMESGYFRDMQSHFTQSLTAQAQKHITLKTYR